MLKQNLNSIEKDTIGKLHEALFFLKIAELKNICLLLQLPNTGVKLDLIGRIIHFLQTGKIIVLAEIPAASKAVKGKKYTLTPNALILFGAYKNDLVTRNFFKSMIGPHFHFTAFGIDYLKERWLSGKPSTYREFADFWQKEYLQRKQEKVAPKQEWALINFMQKYSIDYPNASKEASLAAWKATRNEKVTLVNQILKDLIKSKI